MATGSNSLKKGSKMATGSNSLRRRNSIFAGTLRRIPKELLDQRRGSEPLQLFCKPCLDAGNRKEATTYCGQCQIYMCNACLQGHNAKSKRSHSLPEGMRSYNNVHYDCLKHKSKVVKYFCVNHNMLGCSECVSNNHGKCRNVQCLPEIVEESESKEFIEKKDNIIESLKVSLKHAQKNKTGLREKERMVGETKDRVVNKVKLLKKQMQDILESIVTETENQANKVKNEDMEKIKQQSLEYDYITANVENLITELEQKDDGSHSHELFIATKTAESTMQLIQDKLADLEEDNLISVYHFEPAKEVKRIVDGKISIGSIQKDSTANYMGDINVRSSKDKSVSWISGFVSVSNNCIIAMDHENFTIKMVNTTSNKILSKLRMPSAPWDVTRIDQRYFAVTFPDEKKIQIVSVGSKLSLATAIPVDGECCGIEYADQKLFVSYTDPPMIQILNLQGRVLKTVATDRRRNPFFSQPFYIAVSPNHRYMYISDVKEHTVTCMTTDGQLVNTYKSYSLTGPLGITSDQHGNVYICGGWSKTIHCLQHDCSDGREILRNVAEPQSIAISEDQKKIFVGKISSNKLSIYEID